MSPISNQLEVLRFCEADMMAWEYAICARCYLLSNRIRDLHTIFGFLPLVLEFDHDVDENSHVHCGDVA
jgi:hypothetical protein